MNPIDAARLMALLSRISRYSTPAPVDAKVHESTGVRLDNDLLTYDVYSPKGEYRAVIIGLHGFTLNGRRDPRLIHFARSLARSGIAVYLPTLPGLASCSLDLRDIDGVVKLVQVASSATKMRIGLVGFCFGGSYALVAAGRGGIAPLVRFVLSFGSYYSLEDVYKSYVALAGDESSIITEADWDNWIYLHLVAAYQLRLSPVFSETLNFEIEDLLSRYCHKSTPQEKMLFYKEKLRPLRLMDETIKQQNLDLQRALSPKGNLSALRATVSLIHDPKDIIVPAQQAEELYKAVSTSPNAKQHKLLFTALLFHVELTDLFNIKEIGRLLAALQPIVSECG